MKKVNKQANRVILCLSMLGQQLCLTSFVLNYLHICLSLFFLIFFFIIVDDFSKARQKLKDYNKNGTSVLQSEDEGSMAKRRRKATQYVHYR